MSSSLPLRLPLSWYAVISEDHPTLSLPQTLNPTFASSKLCLKL